MRQRTYVNGKLERSTKPQPIETLRKWLDNIERDWTKNGFMPLTPAGEVDVNGGHSAVRVSPDELIIVSTSSKQIRFVNV